MKKILIDNFEKEHFEKIISHAYKNYDKIVCIYDLTNSQEISLSSLLKDALPIIEKYEEESIKKLEKNIIIAPHTWQKIIVKALLRVGKVRKPYEIYDEISKK